MCLFRLSLAVCLFVPVLAGCDLTGQYDANFQKTLQSSGQRAKFDIGLNTEYEEIVDGEGKPIGIKLRLPKVFDNNKQKKPVLDEKVLAAMAGKVPDAANLGAMGYRLERALDDDKGQFQPVAILIQAMPRRRGSSDAAREAMAKMMPGMNFTDVEVPTPEGQALKLKRRKIIGTEIPGAAKAATEMGVMDMYLVEGPAHTLMISWIAPKGQADKYQLQQTSEAAMGTIQIEGAADRGDAGGKAPPAG